LVAGYILFHLGEVHNHLHTAVVGVHTAVVGIVNTGVEEDYSQKEEVLVGIVQSLVLVVVLVVAQ
jgi:hypothetical protein